MHWEKIEIKVKRQEPIPGKSPGRKGGKHGPGRKWGHTLNAVNYGRQVYVFGGYGKDERQTNDVYVYNTTKDAWSKPNIKGTPPSPRDSHTSTVVGSRLFVFGGTDGSSGLNDLYMLDTSTNTWTRLAAQGDVPAAREGHAAARVEGLVYVFGGCGKAGEGGTVDETYYNDVHVFNPDTMRWARVATTGTAPSPRDSHSCCAWGNQLIVFGGEDSRNCYLSDVFVLDTSSLVWREVRARGQKPLPRAGHVAVTAGRYMVVFGGFTDERRLFNDLHVLDLSSEHWQQYTPTGDVPSRRFSLSADLLDTVSGKMMLFGGCNDDLEALEDAYFLHTGKMMLFGGCNDDLESLEDAYFLHAGMMMLLGKLVSRARAGPLDTVSGKMMLFGEKGEMMLLLGKLVSRADVLDTVSGKMMLLGAVMTTWKALEDAYFVHTVSGEMVLFGGCNHDVEALEDAYFLRADFGSHAVEFPRPRVQRRSFDSMPMPMAMAMDGRMGMDAGVGMCGGGMPLGMCGKRGEGAEGVWVRGAEGVYEAGGMDGDDDDDGYRRPARRMRVPQVSPVLPPGLHPADLIAPAGREVPFEAQIVDVFHLGYCLRATVAGRPLHGLLFSYDPSFAQAALARQAQRQAGTRSSRQPPPPPPHLTFSPETGTHTITGSDNSSSNESASSEFDSTGDSRANDAPQVPGRSPGSPNPVPRSRPSDLDIPFDPAVDAMIAAEMAGRKSNDPPPPAEKERQATQLGTLLKQFVRVAAPYWSSEDKGQARLRLAAVFVFALGCTGVSVLFNFLYRDFYNAIASKDEEAFLRQLLWFLGATVGGVPVFVFRDYLRDTLALRWRAWMTTDLLNKYFQHRTFYNIQSQSLIDNPDQRINEDVADFTTTSLTFSLALVNAIVDLISFSGILYSIYPPLFAVLLAYSLGGTAISVCAILDLISFSGILYSIYPPLFAVLLAYSLGGTAISVYLGRVSAASMPLPCLTSLPLSHSRSQELVGLNFLQEKKEADFRYGLVRARENAESIAFYGGERSETRLLLQRFRQSFANYARLLVVGRNLDFFTSNYRYLIQLLPAAVVAPLYFRGEIEFGVINQSFSAFNHVLGDFSIIVFQFQALSQFSAIVERLGEFQEVLDDQSKPAALPAASAGAAAAAATTGSSKEEKDGQAVSADGEEEKGRGSEHATAAEAAAEHLASLVNSFITIENVILPTSAPSLPPPLLPTSATPNPSHSSTSSAPASGSASVSPRVLLEVDRLTLCTPQYASCLLSGLSLSVKQGEHLL
ncbi:unnamed protein product, partial [Closterium sp. Yama58-4]